MFRFRSPRTGQSLEWLFSALFPKSASVTWARKGALPTGFERADRFAVFPSARGRSFVVSLASRRGTSAALTAYNALRPGRTRWARRVLGLGLRAGVVQPLVRNKIDVGVAVELGHESLPSEFLVAHLGQLLGRQPVVIAFGAGGGPYRKPVLQVFGEDGVPLAYIKVGWNDWARAAIQREAVALQACATHPMRLGVPEFLGLTSWRGLDLLMTGPLPLDSRRVSAGTGLPSASVLREISRLAPGSTGELTAGPWWQGVRSRIVAVGGEPAGRSVLTRVADQVERAHGHVPLTFGAWHGDLVPWNLARSGSRLLAWDWEYSTQNVPLGFDALHYHFQVAFVDQQVPLARAATLAAERAAVTLRELDVPQQAHHLLAVLHLLELAIRHEEARGITGDADERFYPAINEVLVKALARPDELLARQPTEGAV